MVDSLILILITLLIIAFLWLLWMRSRLSHLLFNINESELLIQKEQNMQFALLPLLLESFKKESVYEGAWHELLTCKMDQNLNRLGQTLSVFFSQCQLKSVHFLEAKKLLLDNQARLQNEVRAQNEEIQGYMNLKKQFPFVVASAIFGFPNFDLS